MGSVKIDRFEHKLKALEVKKKDGPTSGNCMPEHFWRPTTQFCEPDTMKRCTQVKPRKYIIGIMSHRMSMCRSNSRKAQDMIIRTTRGNRQKAIRMRVDGWPNFLKTEARSAEKYEPLGEEPYGRRRR